MSREEKIMDNLFEQARNKKVETPVNEIQRWIGLITIGMLLTGLLTKMKLVFTKSVVVMYSTAILTVGIGLGTYLGWWVHSKSAMKFPVWLLVFCFASIGLAFYQLWKSMQRD